MHIQQDYSTDFDPRKSQQQQQQQLKLDSFGSNNYRASFSSFPDTTRTRYHNSQSVLRSGAYRDQPSFSPGSADRYPQEMTSPIQSHMQPYDSQAGYDLGPSQQDLGSGSHKQPFLSDTYEAPLGMLSQTHLNPVGVLYQQQHATQGAFVGYDSNMQLPLQTSYGPRVPTGAIGGVGNPAGPGSAFASGVATSRSSSGAGGSSNQEEISTIFVVGFPDDIQEREFQNMFTFLPGFEAAILKIPNNEYTAYGGVVGSGRDYQPYAGSNDPYNPVTVNQGGVVVDGSRDGTLPSWPAFDDGSAGGPHLGGLGGSAAPRKQIIGFAKFRNRDAALAARDILQGRRVDIEKGAVLKAEMAKKNLHTGRGVGSIQISSGPSANGVVGVGGSSLVRGIDQLELNTNNGTTFPPLPSPAFGASWASAGSEVEQNPPINTLYVGNLPTSPPPVGYPPDYLEECLRDLFSGCPGFRRLVFRHKSNGSMCFVEFEDTHYATVALNNLYGNTLNGLIKGSGIRLSYSKNPLGLRPPPPTRSGSPLQTQQRHMQGINTQRGLSGLIPQDASSVRFGADFSGRASMKSETNGHGSANFGAGSNGMNINGGTMNTVARDQRVEYGDQYVDSNIYHTNSPSIPTVTLSGMAGASFVSVADRMASTYSRIPGSEGNQQHSEIACQPVLGIDRFYATELYRLQFEMGSMVLGLIAIFLHWLRPPG